MKIRTYRQLLGVLILGMTGLIGCAQAATPAAQPGEVHQRWLAALVAGDQASIDALALPREYHDTFVQQTMARMQSYIHDGAGSQGGAFVAMEAAGLRPAGEQHYGFSRWQFEVGQICYRAALVQHAGRWYISEWGQVSIQECER